MRTPFAAVALLALAGCKKLPDLGGIDLKQYAPKVAFERMKVDEVDFDGIDAVFVLSVENRVPVDLSLAGFRYDLDVAGSGFLDGTSEDGLVIPASDTGRVRIPAHLAFADVLALLGGVDDDDDQIPFRLAGDLSVTTPIGPLTVPYDHEGTFPMLKAPRIEPTAVRLGTLNLLQNKATVEVDVALTNRAKSDAYGLSAFAYAIELGGKPAISGDLPDLQVAAGATETRTIPIELNLLALGTTVANAIAQKKPVDVRFDAGLQVATPLGPIPLDIDRTVRLDVR